MAKEWSSQLRGLVTGEVGGLVTGDLQSIPHITNRIISNTFGILIIAENFATLRFLALFNFLE